MSGSHVNDLLLRYGISWARVRAVSNLDCDIYRITPSEWRSHAPALPPGDLALRIYPDEKAELAAVEAEVEWLLTLSDDGVHVPRPVADGEGRIVQPWRERPDAPERHAVLLTWLAGRMHDRGLNPARLQRIGELTARLHLSSQALAQAGRFKTTRPAFGPDLQAWASGRRAASVHVPQTLHRLVAQAAARLAAELDGFSRDDRGHGFVHADLHPWNIVFTGRVAGAFDFSDCGWGHHAMDLATTLQYLKHPLANNHDHRAQYPRLHDSLLAGYARIRPLPADVERQIDAFIVARMVGTLEWILDDWPRPDHRAWGPGFLSRCGVVFADYLDS